MISDCDSDEEDENDDFETTDEASQQKKYEIGDPSSEMEKVCDFHDLSTILETGFLTVCFLYSNKMDHNSLGLKHRNLLSICGQLMCSTTLDVALV